MGENNSVKGGIKSCVVWIVLSVLAAAAFFVAFLLNINETTIGFAIIFAFLTLVALTALYVAVIALLKRAFGREKK
ncbi:MAG: hypothetical protein IJ800_05445 [Clostridia bacterium]|nr:hypothetical protein [Clostridia bacterium]